MGERDSLLEVQQELHDMGQEAYQFEQKCPHCQNQFKEFWERLDWVDLELQRLSSIEESYIFFAELRLSLFGLWRTAGLNFAPTLQF